MELVPAVAVKAPTAAPQVRGTAIAGYPVLCSWRWGDVPAMTEAQERKPMTAVAVQRHEATEPAADRTVNTELGELVPEIGTFILPGRITDPTAALREAVDAERAGFGTVWLSERYDLKDAAAISGAVCALTSRIRFATGLLAVGARHPLITASWATTLQGMFGARLTVGLGRGNPGYLAPQGIPSVSYQATGDYVDILRRLWRGETVDYDGPLGRFPDMAMVDVLDQEPPPLAFGCFGGPRAMRLAASHFDAVFLMPFLTPEAITETIRFRDEECERIGRDPKEVKIIHEMVVAPDLDEQTTLAVVHARALTYIQMSDSGEVLMQRNGWSPDALDHVRAHPVFNGLRTGVADQQFHRAQLIDAAKRLPRSWIEPNAAIGTAAQCARRLREFADLGIDEFCLHGASPAQLHPVMDEWRGIR